MRTISLDNEEMIKQQRIISSFRKHITMRDTKSIKYKKTEEDVSSVGSEESKDSSDNKSEPLEIFIDGPFGSRSSNIYRAEHAVIICNRNRHNTIYINPTINNA